MPLIEPDDVRTPEELYNDLVAERDRARILEAQKKRDEKNATVVEDFLIQMPSRIVYLSSEVLRSRRDMSPFRGTLFQAMEAAKNIVEGHGGLTITGAGDSPPAPTADDADDADGPTAPIEDDAVDARIELIKLAIQNLDPENPEHFTKGGQPRVEAIEAELGDDITMQERDTAWAALSS